MKTEIGVPVHYFDIINFDTEHIYHPAMISFVSGSIVDIRVFPADGSESFVVKDVRHADFAEKNEPFWKHITDEIINDNDQKVKVLSNIKLLDGYLTILLLIVTVALYLFYSYKHIFLGKDCSNMAVMSMVVLCAFVIHEKVLWRKSLTKD